MKFRKKPVVIDAVQWNGDEKMIAAVMDLFGPDGIPHAPDDPHVEAGLGFTPSDGKLYIPTLEGTMTAQPGDFIIRGVKGEVYPCKPDIFAATYESVEPSTSVAAQGQPGSAEYVPVDLYPFMVNLPGTAAVELMARVMDYGCRCFEAGVAASESTSKEK